MPEQTKTGNPDEGEQKKYKVVDRRFMTKEGDLIDNPPPKQEPAQPAPQSDEKPEPPSPPPPPPEEPDQVSEPAPPLEDETQPNDQDQGKQASVEDLLRYFVGVLASQAWLNLGFIADPATGETKVSPADAKLAIDAIQSLFQLLSPYLEDMERKELDRMISDLKINYVNKTQ